MVTITDDTPTIAGDQVCVYIFSVLWCMCSLFRTLSVFVPSLPPVLLLVKPVKVLVWIIVRLVDNIVCILVLWYTIIVGCYKNRPTDQGIILC